MVRLNSIEDKETVLCLGPYTMNRKPIIIHEWNADFKFGEEVLCMIPLWVRLPNLPINCWGNLTLSRIGSVLGRPIYADECTTRIERISYAQILVEMDVTRTLPNMIKVQDPEGQLVDQEVEYDWKPSYCPKCLKIGHICQDPVEEKQTQQVDRAKAVKPKGAKTMWHPKAHIQQAPSQNQGASSGSTNWINECTSELGIPGQNLTPDARSIQATGGNQGTSWQTTKNTFSADRVWKDEAIGTANVLSPLAAVVNREQMPKENAEDSGQFGIGGTVPTNLRL